MVEIDEFVQRTIASSVNVVAEAISVCEANINNENLMIPKDGYIKAKKELTEFMDYINEYKSGHKLGGDL